MMLRAAGALAGILKRLGPSATPGTVDALQSCSEAADSKRLITEKSRFSWLFFREALYLRELSRPPFPPL
jgi:hypothetical protein